MPLDIHYTDELRTSFLCDLVTMITTTLVTGGDLDCLGSAIVLVQSQCLRYNINWPDVVQEAKVQIVTSGMASGLLAVAVQFLEDMTNG